MSTNIEVEDRNLIESSTPPTGQTLAEWQTSVDFLAQSTHRAIEVVEAFEVAGDLRKVLAKAGGVLSVASFGLQVGLWFAGVPSPEEQILNAIGKLDAKVDDLEDHLDRRLDRLETHVTIAPNKVAITEAISGIKTVSLDATEYIAALEQEDRGMAESARSSLRARGREELFDRAANIGELAREYLEALYELSHGHHTEIAGTANIMLGWVLEAVKLDAMVAGLRLEAGRSPEDRDYRKTDADGRLIEQPIDPAKYCQLIERRYRRIVDELQDEVNGLLARCKDEADQNIGSYIGDLLDGELRDRTADQATADRTVELLGCRWPWLDFVVITLKRTDDYYLRVVPDKLKTWKGDWSRVNRKNTRFFVVWSPRVNGDVFHPAWLKTMNAWFYFRARKFSWKPTRMIEMASQVWNGMRQALKGEHIVGVGYYENISRFAPPTGKRYNEYGSYDVWEYPTGQTLLNEVFPDSPRSAPLGDQLYTGWIGGSATTPARVYWWGPTKHEVDQAHKDRVAFYFVIR